MKHSSLLRETGLTLLFLAIATWLITVTNLDRALTAYFPVAGTWPVGDLPFWQFFYKIDRVPSFILGGCSLALALYGCFKPAWASWKRRGLFLVVLLVIGPGILVNSVFKQHWGRPRPREVVEFGGTKQFLHPWQKGISGKGRSFPSGHASAAFYLSAPYFVYRRSNRRRALAWLTGGLVFGILMSVARITQGGHFLSDCLWAWGLVQLTALLLSGLILPDSVDGDQPHPH